MKTRGPFLALLLPILLISGAVLRLQAYTGCDNVLVTQEGNPASTISGFSSDSLATCVYVGACLTSSPVAGVVGPSSTVDQCIRTFYTLTSCGADYVQSYAGVPGASLATAPRIRSSVSLSARRLAGCWKAPVILLSGTST